jgi:hypothetical protein
MSEEGGDRHRAALHRDRGKVCEHRGISDESSPGRHIDLLEVILAEGREAHSQGQLAYMLPTCGYRSGAGFSDGQERWVESRPIIIISGRRNNEMSTSS